MFKFKPELSDIVFKLIVPFFKIFARIVANVPLEYISGELPFNVIAKLANPLLILPFAPSGVNTLLVLNKLPDEILWISKSEESYKKSIDAPKSFCALAMFTCIFMYSPILLFPTTSYVILQFVDANTLLKLNI